MAQPAAVKWASDDQVEQHSVPATVAHHLLPGVVILVVAIGFVPVAKAAGFPPIVGLLVGMLFGLSVQLGLFALARLEAQWPAVIDASAGLSAPAAAVAVSAVRSGDCGLGCGRHIRRHTARVCDFKDSFRLGSCWLHCHDCRRCG